ncbi:acyltransferase [Novosphingobium profundi]|uniref:acyltransferase family protein n=1 Tax=Novosphingobium profundi TaxID=1774954 RepID=UPI001BD98F03|nr:acyltransferase [Novosphingobium profundi]
MDRPSGSNFANVQVLRALAAYMVVCHHVLNNLAHYTAVGWMPEPPALGARGVEIFFVISGFIMVATTDARNPGSLRFAVHRIVRIVPIYWLVTLVAATALGVGFQLFNRDALSPEMLLTSLAFLPDIQPGGEVTKPIVVVGWTLNYEMTFYALFSLCLLARKSVRVVLASAAIGLVWLAQLRGAGGLLGYWGQDIVLAFALGMIVARASDRHVLSVGRAQSVLVLGGVGLVVLDLVLVPRGLAHAGLVSAAAAGAIVLGAVALDRQGRSLRAGWLQRHGDASYSIYLLHPFILQGVGKLWKVSGLNGGVAGLVAMVLVMLLLSALVGLVFHQCVEKPLTRFLRKRADVLLGPPKKVRRHWIGGRGGSGDAGRATSLAE